MVTRLRLDLSYLLEHKFKYSFQDTLNPLCSCGLDVETTSHDFLHCPWFHAEQSTLLNNINEIYSTILNKSESVVTGILLYGDKSSKDEVNLLILNATILFVLSTNRFDEPLWGYNFTILQFYFFVSLAPIIVMVPGGSCFQVYCVLCKL